MTGRRLALGGGLLVLMIVGLVASAASGQLTVASTDVVGTVLGRLGIETSWRPEDDVIDRAVWFIRMPRVVMSMLVGAALAMSGAIMQAVFGNPLAEPGVVGVSAGAAFGAAAVIAAGYDGGWVTATAAFAGALVSTLVVYVTARSEGRTEVVTLLLTGIAVNAFAGAGLALALFAGDTQAREQIVFWQLGSINGTRWVEAGVTAAVFLPAAVVAVCLARRYDLLALGESTARHLGVRVELLRIGSIVLVTLMAAVAVAFVGIIAFVGLVVPHIVRMVLGPSHRALLVVSALGGAALMVWADLLARTLIDGADLPIGLLTSLVGGPFFFWIIHRSRTRAGGWS